MLCRGQHPILHHGLLAYRDRPTLNKPFQIAALKRCCKSLAASVPSSKVSSRGRFQQWLG